MVVVAGKEEGGLLGEGGVGVGGRVPMPFAALLEAVSCVLNFIVSEIFDSDEQVGGLT